LSGHWTTLEDSIDVRSFGDPRSGSADHVFHPPGAWTPRLTTTCLQTQLGGVSQLPNCFASAHCPRRCAKRALEQLRTNAPPPGFSRFPTATRDQPHFQIQHEGSRAVRSGPSQSLTILTPSTMATRPPTERSGSRKNRKRDPTSGLLKGVVETIAPPILEGSEKDIVPEDLTYIGSYNWVDSPNPTIIVPGQ
jgi:hypothetical protein